MSTSVDKTLDFLRQILIALIRGVSIDSDKTTG